MEQVDLIIEAQTLIPLTKPQTSLNEQAVAVKDGKIHAFGTPEAIKQQYQAEEYIKRPHHALLPGFVNMHTHVPMNVLRGLADDYPLMTWLNDHIWPAEGRFMGEEFIHDGTQLAIAEMLRGGTTCFNDMFFFSEIIAKAALDAGIRANIGLHVLDFPTPYGQGPEDYFPKNLQTLNNYRKHDLLTFSIAPHAVYTVCDENLIRCKEIAAEHQLSINMHVQETQFEVEESMRKTGKRPIRRLHELGLLDQRFFAVHMTQVNDEDIEIMQAHNTHVVHCPQSNMKLASGICPIQRLHDAGINVSIGTDGVASNNDLNMIEEMRTATFLAKVSTLEATAIPAHTVLMMGTRHGARALDLENKIGSLEVGKEADLITVDLNQIELLPLYHPESQLIYSAGRENVTDVWVKGKALLQNRELTTLDEEKLKAKAKVWAKKIGSQDKATA